jgi:hypothetical protein
VSTAADAAKGYPVRDRDSSSYLATFVRYRSFRSRGLFTGSGVVEAGRRSVIGQRLRSSGMRWTVPGADAITALRCREASSRWEAICHPPRNQTDAA